MTKPFSGFFESSSIQISNERIEASQFSMVMFEHETSTQIGEGLTCAKSLQNASLAAEITGGEILVAFWPKHDFRSNLKVPNFKKIS